MYVLNERNYIREVLASGVKPDDLSMNYLITLVCKYYYDEDRSPEKLIEFVKDKLLSLNIANYQEYKFYSKIEKTATALYESDMSPAFKELEYVPLYEEELRIIETLPNDRQKKLMFTFFIIARYMNSDGWINKKSLRQLSEVFKLANISLTNQKKMEMLHELYVNGYIQFGKKIDNLNIRVNLAEQGDIVYKLKDFNNIGNQYIGNFKNGYRQCDICGKKIKVTTPNRIYCSSCAKEQNREKTKLRMKTLRNA